MTEATANDHRQTEWIYAKNELQLAGMCADLDQRPSVNVTHAVAASIYLIAALVCPPTGKLFYYGIQDPNMLEPCRLVMLCHAHYSTLAAWIFANCSYDYNRRCCLVTTDIS